MTGWSLLADGRMRAHCCCSRRRQAERQSLREDSFACEGAVVEKLLLSRSSRGERDEEERQTEGFASRRPLRLPAYSSYAITRMHILPRPSCLLILVQHSCTIRKAN